jgi:hypothetical protein
VFLVPTQGMCVVRSPFLLVAVPGNPGTGV